MSIKTTNNRRIYKLAAMVMLVVVLEIGAATIGGRASPNEQTVPTAPPPTTTQPTATAPVRTPTRPPTTPVQLTQAAATQTSEAAGKPNCRGKCGQSDT